MAVAQAQPVQMVQQVQAVPAVIHHHHRQPPMVIQQPQQQYQQGYTYPPAAPGFGGHGSIALPGGGGAGLSWYGNANGDQYQYPSPRQYSE
jgi:hypothetical protein